MTPDGRARGRETDAGAVLGSPVGRLWAAAGHAAAAKKEIAAAK